MNTYYVYIVFRSSGQPCYVGKGKGDRAEQHLRKSHNRYLNRIVAKDGGDLPIVKVQENLTETAAFELEKLLIFTIGRKKDGGPLVNQTDGGDGVSGWVQTPSQIEKLRATRVGRKLSEESRHKVSVALAGRSKTKAHGDAISKAKKGISAGPMSDAHKEAIRQAHIGQKRSPEMIASMKRAEAAKSPENQALKSARISAALTGKKLSEQHRKKISKIQRGVPKKQNTQVEILDMVCRYISGESLSAIGKIYGLSCDAIAARLRRQNVSIRGRGVKKDARLLALMAA